ncbi:phosphoserine aminotransferase 2, chloroplastic-like [Senna tora]|uniref:phosphoserine transaminase n=1 Tax=Senna tora TaxID=362788 RepID=A0A834SVP5_9FABA|nr:phosphoserine aminotransferase 2, chloroplastic-like [Senna tora]
MGASPRTHHLLQNPNHLFNSPTIQNHVFPATSIRAAATAVRPISIKSAATPTRISDRPSAHTPSQDRLFNFAAGPATLPESVLKKAESELYIWRESGMSVMEMSHRGKDFLSIIQKAEADLRALLDIPTEYAVLFLQGGATTQFAAVPLNLCNPDDPVDYLVTGSWGDKAFKEAQKFCKPNVIWSGKSDKYTKIPCFNELDQNMHARFGVIYAGAQKNVGPSGVTIVIIRKDLLGNAQSITPVMLDYKVHAENNSLYNTPPCYVEKSVRSLMNVPFTMERSELEGEFMKEAAMEKMVQLKGHRSVGGMRASIYNAMPLIGVEKLVAFMKDFQARHA